MEGVALLFLFVVVAPTDSLYDEYCKADLVFKPYMKVYDGRTDPDDPLEWGRELYERGAGLYDTEEWSNAYVCLNGPVWLYYERKTSHGIVFDAPTFKIFHHECQFFNGDKGPGSTTEKVTLQAILLMGQDEDYRRPFLQLFTAPLYNSETLKYENVTSLMTIGNTVCTINKGGGPNKETIAVIAEPDDKDSHCRLSYKNMDKLFPVGTVAVLPATPPPLDLTSENKAALVANTLKNDRMLRKGSCNVHDERPLAGNYNMSVYNMTTFQDISSTNYKTVSTRWEEIKKSYDALATKPRTVDVLDPFISPVAADPAVGLTTDQLEDKRKAEFEKAARLQYDEVDKIMTAATDPSKKSEFNVGDLLDTLEKEVMTDTVLTGFVKDFIEGPAKILDLENALKACPTAPAASPCVVADAQKALDDAKTAFNDKKDKLEKVVITVNILLAKLKAVLQKMEGVLDDLDKALTEFKDQTDTTLAVTSRKNFTGDYKPKRSSAPFIIMPKVQLPPATPPDDITRCKPFPKTDDVCASNRPDKVRACQLLKAAMGTPHSCATSEKATDPKTVVVPPLTDLLDDTVMHVLRLIEEIFTKACPRKRFHGNLAKSMNYMFQCYIVKLMEDGGAGVKKKPKGSAPDPKDVENHRFWVHVKEALNDCKNNAQTLRFNETVTGSGEYKFWALKKTGGYEERPVEHLKEQADKEYSFNFALDMHFKIFVTVMGLCMPNYEMKIPLITTMFYAKYTETFFQPLRKTWTDPRDNQVLRVIFGNFYNGQSLFWATQCMEASFVQSGEKNYRPPRDLPVNAGIEQNFFTSGPLAHSKSRYS